VAESLAVAVGAVVAVDDLALAAAGFLAAEALAAAGFLAVEALPAADGFLAVEALPAADGFLAVEALPAADGFLAVEALPAADGFLAAEVLAARVRLAGAAVVFGCSAAASVYPAAGPRFVLRRWGRVEGSDPITPRRSSLMGLMIAALGESFAMWQ
jgi:hypothetical protein